MSSGLGLSDIGLRRFELRLVSLQINSQDYTLVFNHITGEIDVIQGKLTGTRLHSFTNANTAREVKDFFASL